MADLPEILKMTDEGRFDDLAEIGVTISGVPAVDVKQGWLRTVFPHGAKTHYFTLQDSSYINEHGRWYYWIASCGHEAFTCAKQPMLNPGNWPRCKRCERKEKAND